MKFPQAHVLSQIATIISAKPIGDPNFRITGMNEIHRVAPGDIVFVDHPKYYNTALDSKASVVLIDTEVKCPDGKALLISDDPFRDFNILTNYFRPFEKANNLHAPTAQIAGDTCIQPGVFIGNHVKIGKGCLIHSNVSIYDHSVIGDHVVIHAGTVIGSDAFYYKKRKQLGFDKLKSGGLVHIGNAVEIGAACTIDRGVSNATTIQKGTKIDNQVHIGHDTIIGERCLIAAQVGIAGCVRIEDEVTIWGQVGITSGVTIGKHTVLGAQSGVSKSLEGGKSYFGTPADELRKKYRELAILKQFSEQSEK